MSPKVSVLRGKNKGGGSGYVLILKNPVGEPFCRQVVDLGME